MIDDEFEKEVMILDRKSSFKERIVDRLEIAKNVIVTAVMFVLWPFVWPIFAHLNKKKDEGFSEENIHPDSKKDLQEILTLLADHHNNSKRIKELMNKIRERKKDV